MPIHGNLPRTCGDKPQRGNVAVDNYTSTPHMRG